MKNYLHRKFLVSFLIVLLIVSVFSFLLVQQAYATAIILVQGNARGTSDFTGSIPVTMGSTPTQGNLLIACIGLNKGGSETVSSISEFGVAWTKAYSRDESDYTIEIWQGVVGVGASTNITVTLSDSSTVAVADVCEWSGLDPDPVDKTAYQPEQSGLATDTGTTDTTTQSVELWIGATLDNSATQSTPTNGFALLDGAVFSGTYSACLAYLYKIVSSTGAANSGTTIDGGIAKPWMGAIVTFKAATYPYVQQQSNVDSSADIGTHSNFTAQQYGPDLINDTLTEADAGGGSSTTDVFTDGFEAANFDLWTDGGTTTWDDGDGVPSTYIGSPWTVHGGSYYATCDSNDDGDLISNNIDCSDATAIGIGFWFMNDDLDGTDYQVYYYDGSSYNLIQSIGGIDPEDTWFFYSDIIANNDSGYFISTFRLDLRAAPGTGEVAFLDDVAINKTTVSINYRLDLEEQFTDVPTDVYTNRELCLFMGAYSDAETLGVEGWNISDSSWVTISSSLSANQWNNASVDALLGSYDNFTIRFLDGSQSSDEVQSTWDKDCALLNLYNVSNTAPTNDACDSDSNFNVGADGWVNMTVSDIDGVTNFNTVSVLVTTADSKTFRLNWTQATNTFSEELDADGICTLNDSGSTRVNVDSDTDLIAFYFSVNAGTQYGDCNVTAQTIDDGGLSDLDSYINEFTINAYSSFTILSGNETHSWTAEPNTNDNLITEGAIYFNVTANFAFNIQAKGSGNLASDGNTIELGNVTIHKDTLGSSLPLTTDYANVGGLTSQAIGVDVTLSVKVWIDVPDGTPVGAYTYTLYLQATEA